RPENGGQKKPRCWRGSFGFLLLSRIRFLRAIRLWWLLLLYFRRSYFFYLFFLLLLGVFWLRCLAKISKLPLLNRNLFLCANNNQQIPCHLFYRYKKQLDMMIRAFRPRA